MEHDFPYDYGSDLHWLWGWSQRIDDWQTNDCIPTRLEHFVFRPDRLARKAATTLAIKYGQVIRQVLDYLDHTEASYNAFLTDSDPQSWENFAAVYIGSQSSPDFQRSMTSAEFFYRTRCRVLLLTLTTVSSNHGSAGSTRGPAWKLHPNTEVIIKSI